MEKLLQGTRPEEYQGWQALEQQLQTINIDLYFASPFLVRYLVAWKDVKIVRSSSNLIKYPSTVKQQHRYEDMKGADSYTITTRSSPAILFETSVLYCTLMITIDSRGDAVLIHYPFGNSYGQPAPSENFDLELNGYQRGVSKLTKGKQITIVSGMNTSEKEREYVLRIIGEEMAQEDRIITTLFTSDLFEMPHYIGKMIYIPPYISRTGRGALLIDSSRRKDHKYTDILLPRYTPIRRLLQHLGGMLLKKKR